MKKEVVKLKSAEKLYREFDNTCTSRAMIKETGIHANLIHIIEVISIVLVIFIYYFYKFYKLGFKFNAKTFEILIKYNVISKEQAKKLISKKKIEIPNAQSILENFKNQVSEKK